MKNLFQITPLTIQFYIILTVIFSVSRNSIARKRHSLMVVGKGKKLRENNLMNR